mmetsp:Transcript_16101/g.34922  ORF Transcript_16101/g.34922 Transcript_16101/m.34922 type:complete len:362 (+) Transcript_16101:3313-4398(+)
MVVAGALAWLIPQWAQKPVGFVLIYVVYVAFYFDRKNYAFWLNELVTTVGKTKEEASVFGSVMEMSYGVGKLVAGPICDSLPPSIILYGSLAIASLCNLFMFRTNWSIVDASLWATNGLVQSAAWPALAAIFMNWFRDSPNRAIWYSVLSTNQNLGSALIPVVLAPLVANFGWRAAVGAPGLFGLCFALILFLFLQEGPTESSLQEKTKKNVKRPSAKSTAQSDWRTTFLEMVTNLDIISLSVGYMFLTMLRVGISDWSFVILKEHRGVELAVARNCMISLEFGGFLGGLSTGFVSDRIFGGKRGPPIVLFTLLIAPVILAIFWLPLPQETLPLALPVFYFLFGFLSFGPHMLVGLTVRCA